MSLDKDNVDEMQDRFNNERKYAERAQRQLSRAQMAENVHLPSE